MAQGRGERKKTERPADEVRFRPLGEARWEDSGYLPPDDDQSWREMEALRIAAYDRIGHLPPQDDQSWREREALRIAATRVENDAEEPAEGAPEPRVPPPEFQPVRRGSGGVLFLLGGFVGLVVLAFAAPDLLSPDFWRAQWAASTKPAAVPQRVAAIPAPPSTAAIPPPPTQAQPGPALNAAEPPANDAPLASVEPPVNAEPPVETNVDAAPDVMPRPRPDARAPNDRADGSSMMVIRPDGTVKYEKQAAGSKSGTARTSAREEPDAGGVYAMAPGADGKLQYQYFPSTPLAGARPAARLPAKDDRAQDGVYAMAPGPDGKLRYQFFPSKPPR